jgi:hypothetical protein
MAQRKPPSGGKPVAKKGTSRPAGKPASGSTGKVSTSKAAGAKGATGKTPPAKATSAGSLRKPPPRKPGKSIVNQKQTPWGTIAAVVAVVLFAGAVIGVVIATHKSGSSGGKGCANSANARYCLPELAAAKQIQGVTYRKEPDHNHVDGVLKYNTTPPVGGNHSQYWADCDGTVYPQPIANENAVHALEHGAVWLTYKEGIPQSQVATLAKDVTGQTKVFMSPYPGLSSTVSLQAWGYQLKVNSVSDPRIAAFIGALAGNDSITPEITSCSDPTFKANPSTFGHPLWVPAAGGTVPAMTTTPPPGSAAP